MGASPIQLSFTLRTSPNCKTVHLVGNWDGYKGQLPLSKDASKAGAWKGTFRFQGNTLSAGQRYWYYYIMDGYHVSHDPAKPFTTEPTTKRQLNILDVPASSSSSSSSSSKPKMTVDTSVADKRRSSAGVPKGRPVSPSRIVSPKPVKPTSAVDNITRSLAHTRIAEPSSDDSSDSEIDDSESDVESDAGSDASVPSLTSSRSSRSNSSCGSPVSDASTGSQCSCNRFGITRKGDRVRLDCGGSRCGYSDGSDCSDSEPEVAAPTAAYHERATRRQGVVIRGSRR